MEGFPGTIRSERSRSNTQTHLNQHPHNTQTLQRKNTSTLQIHTVYEQNLPTVYVLNFPCLPDQGMGRPGLPAPLVPYQRNAAIQLNCHPTVISEWPTVPLNNWLAVGNENNFVLV